VVRGEVVAGGALRGGVVMRAELNEWLVGRLVEYGIHGWLVLLAAAGVDEQISLNPALRLTVEIAALQEVLAGVFRSVSCKSS